MERSSIADWISENIILSIVGAILSAISGVWIFATTRKKDDLQVLREIITEVQGNYKSLKSDFDEMREEGAKRMDVQKKWYEQQIEDLKVWYEKKIESYKAELAELTDEVTDLRTRLEIYETPVAPKRKHKGP
jgi:chromosome segregation ATPase